MFPSDNDHYDDDDDDVGGGVDDYDDGKLPHTAHYLSLRLPLCYDHHRIDHDHDDGHDDEHHDDDYVVRHEDDGEDDHLASAVVDQSVADATRLLRLDSLNFS